MLSNTPKTQILSVTTLISLVLFFSISYQFARLPHFRVDILSHIVHNATNVTENFNPNLAVIIETRPIPNLVPLILHFSSVLGPDWPIRVIHSPSNADLFQANPLRRQIESNHIELSLIPSNISLKTSNDVSSYLTRPFFWQSLAPKKHILLFQSDSILCSNSPHRVEEFLQYDFIGAPITPNLGHDLGYNGGLSLRSREKMLEVLRYNNYTDGFEDQWYYSKLKELPTGPHYEPGANLPTQEVAKKFAVETMWHDQPFGLHQVHRWQSKHEAHLREWCPEYLLAGDASFCKEGSDCYEAGGVSE
ncbi:MAG: hypothetical protein LQ351_002773 [Letrouitia transgressa]|nr:MAG: hypothetical protein LQ351_002773 [Letrouitia transgressa]